MKVALTFAFTTQDLEAIAAATGHDEPSRADLRYWMIRIIRRAADKAIAEMDKGDRPEEPDVDF